MAKQRRAHGRQQYHTGRRARWQRTRTLPSAAVRSGDVTAIRRVSARNDLVETSRHHPLGQYLGPTCYDGMGCEQGATVTDLRSDKLLEAVNCPGAATIG